MTASAEPRWPGEHLGLPASGPRSIARLGRRLIAIFIDWGIALGLSIALFPVRSSDPAEWVTTNPWVTLAIFAGVQLVLLWLFNGSIGHLVVRSRVVPLTPGRLAFWRPLVRTALLCLAVPALIWDRDQRGLHDRVAGTLLVRV